MGVTSFDHGVLKGMIASVTKLSTSYLAKYPSLAIIATALIALDQDFTKERAVEEQLVAWENKGFDLRDFRYRLNRKKVTDLRREFGELKRDIEAAERVRRQLSLSRLPYYERSKLDSELKLNPSRAYEIERELQMALQPGGFR